LSTSERSGFVHPPARRVQLRERVLYRLTAERWEQQAKR
jgi:hypothetical protein